MPKIFYVEDNDDNVFMMQKRLTRAGSAVVVSPDGERGTVLVGARKQ